MKVNDWKSGEKPCSCPFIEESRAALDNEKTADNPNYTNSCGKHGGEICPKYPQSTCRSLQWGGGLNKLLRFTVLSTAQSHEYTINHKPREHTHQGSESKQKTLKKHQRTTAAAAASTCGNPDKREQADHVCHPIMSPFISVTSVTLVSPWSSNCHLQTRLLTQNTLTKPLPTTPQRSSQTLEAKVRG